MNKKIAPAVRDCLASFQAILEQVGEIERTTIEDEYGRFRVWSGNISAHRTGRRSLEYRLRDSSNLQATVTGLLEDLQDALQQLHQLANQHQSRDGGSMALSQLDHKALDLEDKEDAELFGLDVDDLSPEAALGQALDEVHDVVTCLLRFSMTLRNPARHDQLKQVATITTKHFEPHDINHVREKYPMSPSFLHRRLGKAISKHRQYFKYREEHHQKLVEGLDDTAEQQEERPSTIATSLNQPDSTVPQAGAADVEDDSESVYTATSFAPTTTGHAALRPPPLPEAGLNGDPFECPLCYGIIVAEDQRSWRQHVFEDLPPYICTFEDCISADHKYSRRRDWQRHQAKFHNRYWVCPFGCAGKIGLERDFHEHLAKQHSQNLDPASLQRISDACTVADELVDLNCPLCHDTLPTSKRWFKHLGHHLEQFALHALPQHVLGDSDGEEPEIVDGSDDDSVHGNDVPRSDANLYFLDQLAKFHKGNGQDFNRFPSIRGHRLDLYRLQKAVERRGGFESVYNFNEWAAVGQELGYDNDVLLSLLTSLQNTYLKWILPYEQYLKLSRPSGDEDDHELNAASTHSQQDHVKTVSDDYNVGYVCIECLDREDFADLKWWPRLDNFKVHVQRKHPSANVEAVIQASAKKATARVLSSQGLENATPDDVAVPARPKHTRKVSDGRPSTVYEGTEGPMTAAQGTSGTGLQIEEGEELNPSWLSDQDRHNYQVEEWYQPAVERYFRNERIRQRNAAAESDRPNTGSADAEGSAQPSDGLSNQLAMPLGGEQFLKNHYTRGERRNSKRDISRPLTNTEEWSIWHFEQHASMCRSCFDPRAVHKNGGALCFEGKALAQDVALNLFSREEQIHSTRKEQGENAKVDIRPGYFHVLGLLETMDSHLRSSRHPDSVHRGVSRDFETAVEDGTRHRVTPVVVEVRPSRGVSKDSAASGSKSTPGEARRNVGGGQQISARKKSKK